MKEFDIQKFCDDLIALRGHQTQAEFAPKLNLDATTLSQLEEGEQIPNMDVFNQFCVMSGKPADAYFVDEPEDALVYMMGRLDESDRKKIEELSDRIGIREKYELLAKRGSYVNGKY